MTSLTPEQIARRKKINKVLSAVTGVILVAFFIIYALTNDKDHPPTAKTSQAALIPYEQGEISDTSTSRRKRAQVSIHLADPAAVVTPASLTATCMAAAQFYAREYDKDALSVFLSDMPGPQSWEGTRLAQCSYSRDNGGWSGDQGWTWADMKVAPRGLTDQEREMKRLWGELRGQYQKDGSTDEDALSAEIAKRMGIQPDQVTLLWFLLEDAKADNAPNVQAQGPTVPAKAPMR